MDLSTFIVSVFCLAEDFLKGGKLRSRGPAPKLSDAEVITMEVVGEFLAIDTDKAIHAYFRRHYHEWFPAIAQVHRTTFSLIYAHDESAGIKREAARAIVERLWEERSGRLSVRVLQEFFVNATVRSGKRKSGEPLDIREAREVVEDFSRQEVHRPGGGAHVGAIDIHPRVDISFWDAMIVQSASAQGCEVLFSKDLNDGQIYEGVRLENPFIPYRLPEEEDDRDA